MSAVIGIELLHGLTTFLSTVAFLILVIICLVILARDRPSGASGMLALVLSAVLKKRTGAAYFTLFNLSIILFVVAMAYKYPLGLHEIYTVIEIFAEVLAVASLSALLISYLQHRKTIIAGKLATE